MKIPRSKYGAVPTVVDGVRFASKAEAKRDAELWLLARADKISDLRRQPRIPLTVNGVKICTYVGDWEYREYSDGEDGGLGVRVVEDRKGFAKNPVFLLKWKLCKALFPEIEWRIS